MKEKYISIEIDQDEPLKYLDIFAYSTEGIRELLLYERIQSNMLPYCRIPLPDSTLIDMVAISNAPGEFCPSLLSMQSAIENLSVPFCMEDPLAPVCSASSQLNENQEKLFVVLKPLRSVITLRSVSNFLEKDVVLENPRVRLMNIPTEAGVLRWSGFNCADVTTGEWQSLPCDIGFLTQYPQTQLYCYPSDNKMQGGGTRWPELELSFEIRESGGQLQTHSCKTEIGPVARANEIFLDVEITSLSSKSANTFEQQVFASFGEEEPYSLRIHRSGYCDIL